MGELDRTLYVEANSLTEASQIKASFLLLMGQEAFEIYTTKRKSDSSDTLKEIETFMADHLIPKKSEYAEICVFRRAMRHDGEPVSEYAMILRALSTYCIFGTSLDKEI